MSDKLILEQSEPFPSPTGEYEARVSSNTSTPGRSLSQVSVSHSFGGSGLIAFYAPRVSMSLVWTGDDELTVRYPNELPPPRMDETNSTFGFGGKGQAIYVAVPPSEILPLTWSAVDEIRVLSETPMERGTLVTLKISGRRAYTYSYYDADEPDSSSEMLQSIGLQGGGETWAGIVQALVALHAPKTMKDLELDPEADGLSIRSKKRSALITVAELIASAKRDPSVLMAALERARADGEIE